MLPAQGLFRSHPCPFFLAGLCERPHCYFRHCASDIKIDRKLEAQALEDSFKPETSEKARTSGVSGSSRRNSCGESSKPPSSKNSSPSTVSKSNDKKEETASSRLKTDKPLEAQSTRKRSCDLENTKPAKRLKPNEELESDTMGSVIGKLTETIKQCSSDIASVFKGSAASDSSNNSTFVEDDIDKIVAEIEGTGKKSSPSSHRSHKSHKHKHRKSDRDSERHSPSKSKNDSSHRTSDRKENKSSSNNDSRKSRSHHREKDEKKDPHRRSRDSESSSSSSRHHKSSHKDKDKDSSKHSEKSGKSHQSSSNAHKDERRSSKTSESSRDTSLDTLRSVQNSIDVQNRFDALVQSAASDSNSIGAKGNESFSDFDVFDESLDFKYAGSDSDEDPEDIARECREMFENYKPEDEPRTSTPLINPPPTDVGKMDESDDGFSVVASKKRVAHANPSISPSSSSSSPLPPKRAPGGTSSLHDAVFKRFEQQNNQTLPKQQPEPQKSNKTQHIPTSTSTSASAFAKPKGKQRIAHVPNASALAKRPIVNQASTSICNGPLSNSLPGKPGALTYSQTAAKGTKREAHQPSASVTQQVKPLVIKDAINKGSKIPHATRQRIMDSLYTEFCQILGNPKQAFETTIKKEDELYSKHTLKHIYYNAGVAVIAACRSQRANNGSSIVPNRVVSHQDILTGSLVAKNCSVLGTRKNDSLPQGAALYQALRKYIMTEQQLIDNGYPRPHPSGIRGKATAKPRMGDENLDMTLTLRKCDRCKKKYQTTEDGDHIGSELCNYHWGRKYSQMSRAGRGARESTYTCCGSDDDKLGCATAVCHVSKSPTSISEQKGFVEAVLDEGAADNMGKVAWDVIGIDCEMVYTTHGNELARVTVVDVNSVVLYDEKVKPTHRVLDCNTRFSGLTLEDLEQATKGITEIQAILLARIRPNTIIIGHSLESDLLALRLIHDCVIDTSVLYPHRMGPPKKRALKTLSSEYLKKVIQESLHGHDSAEDAQIAVELVLAKLKTDGRK